MRKNDLLGQRFSRLVVSKDLEENMKGHALWECTCDCGKKVNVLAINLRNMNTHSCGCYKSERVRSTVTKHGEADKAPEYFNWLALKNRCKNKSHINYHRYGGRGIKVCDRWIDSYENFVADMGRRPTNKHSVDRINPDGDYTPENCRWATPTEQANNKSKE
jgi:hypothetical protein